MKKINISQIKIDKIFKIKYNEDFDNICLKKLVEKYGQTRPLILDQDLNLVDGYNLYTVLLDLKILDVFCIEIKTNNYTCSRLEFNLSKKKIDPLPFYKKLQSLNNENKLETLISPFPHSTLKNWVQMLNWSWDNYKTCGVQDEEDENFLW